MKTLTTTTLIGLLCGFCLSASGQQVVTLTQNGGGTNSLVIAEDQFFTILNVFRNNVAVLKDGVEIVVKPQDFSPTTAGANQIRPATYPVKLSFAGPAVIEARVSPSTSTEYSMTTIEISPSQYPPDKSAVIGERDGPMKCTLEESTDLVNWTLSTSGQTHSLTNANAKKFFRIKLEQDTSP